MPSFLGVAELLVLIVLVLGPVLLVAGIVWLAKKRAEVNQARGPHGPQDRTRRPPQVR
ncbi:hypothetical protein [Gephyromycinifex aptenodytis]|uniref:hypothetical protein n=1 Tax=Gephyromycinifex aptenodytis TaxID=2716227 RepID=UPI0014485329|nr:hypothetical protein [Gephyromycinifex aptenodytis]